ncbi:MAG: glutamate-5-semialdehyde dehydrogenase [Bacteroidales bacterium]|jgi:glutamate-5-semialdehyde dehydrogenase|nr:glutamate-5-semialdehyde dehydrogenase [Bacteroidales bacterium]MBP8981714.1 glutamate-5-semialdehyde dehydrogenase [Bacteroidales bacterium]NLV38620.1 glutamate-5-semialdehyde dehydrogenase [Bacteroidales bacterium]HNZ80284.1 glutamate-5-semialdehyde dehydrogenase [Bacteroidales bacterium]HOH23565.1 glutamate-5-semialdehyde dehydrogenase [Bacteroidales bacterium]
MSLENKFKAVKQASALLNDLSDIAVRQLLTDLAAEAEAQIPYLLTENQKDLDRMNPADPKYDRLKLSAERIHGIASDMRQVAALSSPLGEILSKELRPNGMLIQKIRVPFGVIGIIYEARPNVSFDVFSLCIKTGNACILKGGSDAEYSNTAIVQLIRQQLLKHGFPDDAVLLLPPDRRAADELMKATAYVDLIIPRGSQSLIDHVRSHSLVPVIETGAGICHTYIDSSADIQKAATIVHNAKTRRVSVCNALDCMLLHRSRLQDLPEICLKLQDEQVVIYADPEALAALKSHYPGHLLQPAGEKHYGTEFLDYKMAVKTVKSTEEAIEHIARYSSGHSEAIVCEDTEQAQLFCKKVDAACVYVNVSTAFTDGAQFGLGAEIGISTQKLHARGPMALKEITTYKYLITGNGQIRSK